MHSARITAMYVERLRALDDAQVAQLAALVPLLDRLVDAG